MASYDIREGWKWLAFVNYDFFPWKWLTGAQLLIQVRISRSKEFHFGDLFPCDMWNDFHMLHESHEIWFYAKWDSTHGCKGRLNQTLQNLQTLKSWKTQNSSLCGRDLWWPSFISYYHVVSHSGWQPLPKITKMAIVTSKLKLKNSNSKIQNSKLNLKTLN